MPDESTTHRKSTAVSHSGAQPPIPSLDSADIGAAQRAPFNDPMPPARNESSETRSPSRLPREQDDTKAAGSR